MLVNINKMLTQIVEDIQKYPTDNIHVQINEGVGEITLSTNKYLLSILINRKWIGYDFALNKELTNGIPQGSAVDTDLYPLEHDIKVTNEIYNEVRYFLESLLSNNLYYGTLNKKAVFARPISKDKYELTFIPRRRFFVKIQRRVWTRNKVRSSLTQLVAN